MEITMNLEIQLEKLHKDYKKNINRLLKSQCPIIINDTDVLADILKISDYYYEWIEIEDILKKYELYSNFYVDKDGKYIPQQKNYLYKEDHNRILRVISETNIYANIFPQNVTSSQYYYTCAPVLICDTFDNYPNQTTIANLLKIADILR